MATDEPIIQDEQSAEGEAGRESAQERLRPKERRRPIELKKKRSNPTPKALLYPPLTEERILQWADQHRRRAGKWPNVNAGKVVDGGGATWAGLDRALSRGFRTLPGGSSLAALLERHRGHRNRAHLPPLTEDRILEWADQHHVRTGEWPTAGSGEVDGTAGENWRDLAQALVKGLRSLPGGSSLARLLRSHRDKRHPADLPPLTEERILGWADQHHMRTGEWPTKDSGPVVGGEGETWCALSHALLRGARSLPGGSSLARLLEARRGRPNKSNLPRLTPEQILAWVDAYRERTGQWPTPNSGPIPELPGETWDRVNTSLQQGIRGLQKGGSLARLLWERRGVRHHLASPDLTEEAILGWADAFSARHGRWPTLYDGALEADPQESWAKIDSALRVGLRGLSGGASLSRLLAERRGARNPMRLPDLTVEQVLGWADAYCRRTRAWPTESSEPIPEAPGETWNSIALALRSGRRGLPAGTSLARLVESRRGRSCRQYRGALTVERILEWADAHHGRTGRWPGTKSGAVADAGGITWRTVHRSLVDGLHGLPGGETLCGLLERERGGRSRTAAAGLSEAAILEWAQAHFRRTGKRPSARSGTVMEAPGETWRGIDTALVKGKRGLPGGSSLARLLNRIRDLGDAGRD